MSLGYQERLLLLRYLRHTRGKEAAGAAFRDFMVLVVRLKEISELIRGRTITMSLAA